MSGRQTRMVPRFPNSVLGAGGVPFKIGHGGFNIVKEAVVTSHLLEVSSGGPGHRPVAARRRLLP